MLALPFALAALGLLARTASASPSSSAASQQLVKRVTLVDPSALSYNFSAVLTSQALCARPCGGLSGLEVACESNNTCTERALCTTAGLNSLVTCNNCLLQLANRTTGVTQALYQNTTAILADTESACASSPSSSSSSSSSSPSPAPKANATVIPWAQFVPPSSDSTSTTGGRTESIGQAGDEAAASKSAGAGGSTSGKGTSGAGRRWTGAATKGNVAVVGLVMAGLAVL